MFHCIHGILFKKDGDLFFFFFVERVGLIREGFIISFLRAPGPLQRVYVIMGKQSGASLPVACVTPFAQHRVTRLPPYIFFFHKKLILQLYIMYCYYIFSYYMRTKKGFFRGKMR